MIALSVPFVDARANQLVYSLSAGPIPPVATRTFRVPGVGGDAGAGAGAAGESGVTAVGATTSAIWEVELAVLGSSHQVTVTRTGEVMVRETLACVPGATPHLPRSQESDVAGGVVRFSSVVTRPSSFAEAVATIRSSLTSADYRVAAVFPGDPDALTALVLEPGFHAGVELNRVTGVTLKWRTWHCYAQSGEIVETFTSFACQSKSDTSM